MNNFILLVEEAKSVRAWHLVQISTILFVNLEWAPGLKAGRFYYGSSLKHRENSLHLEVSMVNN